MLALWIRYHPQLVRDGLIAEIEKNCVQYGVFFPSAYEAFQKNKFAEKSMYFHHGCVENDIPIGQKYEAVALVDEHWRIQPDSIRRCPSEILCFFTVYKIQPSDYAARGHHELSLIQFKEGIPDIIYDLEEIKERKPCDYHKQVWLGTEAELWAQEEKMRRPYWRRG